MFILRTSVLALILIFADTAFAQPTLEERLDSLQQEIDSIKAQLVKQGQQQPAQKPQQAPKPQPIQARQSKQTEQQQANTATANEPKSVGLTSRNTTIGGYGEFVYNKYRNTDVNNNQADLSRFVLSLGHRFTDDQRFFGELEYEHALRRDA